MADGNFILTQEGKDKLEEELHFLETEKRAEIGERIKVAREFGDISENSEYDDAKNEQGMMEARIAEISRILSEATVVNTPKRSNSVHIGSTVTVDMGGRERVFTIVGGERCRRRQDLQRVPGGFGAAGPQEGRRGGDHGSHRPQDHHDHSQAGTLVSCAVLRTAQLADAARRPCTRSRGEAEGLAYRSIPYGDFLRGALRPRPPHDLGHQGASR